VGLDAGVDDQTPPTAPMFSIGERTDAVNVGRGTAAGKRDPHKIAKRLRSEPAVIDNHNQWKPVAQIVGPKHIRKPFQFGIRGPIQFRFRAANRQHTFWMSDPLSRSNRLSYLLGLPIPVFP